MAKEPKAVSALRARDQTLPKLSDESVATACSTGDSAAVAELFLRFHAPVTRYLSRLVPSRTDVEDLLQTTFLQIAKGRAHYAGRASVRTWLLGIATNVVKHHRRSGARLLRLLDAARREPPPAPPWPCDDDAAKRALRRIEQALSSLSPEQRFAFVLCEIEGLSAREAALILETSEQAVWRRVSDARRALRALLPRDQP
jgi:RNA polymerase sigma-70 factor, ECF subfamily